MNKKIYLNIGVAIIASVFLCGCAGTIPVSYTAQNFVRYQGRAAIGPFTYAPADQHKVQPNQIQNTAIGTVYIAANVADFVQRATALELEKTGFQLDDSNPLQVSGDVLKFKADDFGYSVEWTYSIRYKITRKSDSKILLDKVYTPEPKKTGKFGLPSDYTSSVNEVILAGYDKFIRDEDVKKIFAQ